MEPYFKTFVEVVINIEVHAYSSTLL